MVASDPILPLAGRGCNARRRRAVQRGRGLARVRGVPSLRRGRWRDYVRAWLSQRRCALSCDHGQSQPYSGPDESQYRYRWRMGAGGRGLRVLLPVLRRCLRTRHQCRRAYDESVVVVAMAPLVMDVAADALWSDEEAEGEE